MAEVQAEGPNQLKYGIRILKNTPSIINLISYDKNVEESE